MFIKKLEIDNNGILIDLEKQTDYPVLIESVDSTPIVSTIKKILYSPQEVSKVDAAAELVLNGGIYNIRTVKNSSNLIVNLNYRDYSSEESAFSFFSRIKRSYEENRISIIDGKAKIEDYTLERYSYGSGILSRRELSKITCGMGITHSFRTMLRHYLNNRSALHIADKVNLAYCFFETVRFWDEFEKMRNIHYEGKPLLIVDSPPVFLEQIFKYKKSINRQIIVINRR